ncbi:hypothetical protein P7H17_15645 [Paenibacillus larvae]|nr:hypothetical protein [Paenibacillus larvae]MDT2287171.1 hypothetical protein [Paenibacillus larvae]
MKMDEKELQHLVFLSEVVLTGNKKGLMKETLQCVIICGQIRPECRSA